MNELWNLHFVRPWWFLALLPLAGLLWWLARHKSYTAAWEAVCDPYLLPFILLGRSMADKKRFLYLVGLAGLLAITALAGPVWERLPQPTFRDHSALVVAIDLSRSMDAVDIQPSRLQRARYKVNDFINQYRQEVALVAYSDSAFVVVPLTDDMNAVELYLQSISTKLMPSQGSRPDEALRLSEELLKRRGLKQGNIILVTDYGDQRAVTVAERLALKNYQVSVLGVGTEQGAPIFLSQGNFLKDKGETVIPKLDESILKSIAAAGGGIYQRLQVAGSKDIDNLVQWAEATAKADIDTESRGGLTDAWREQGPWLLLLLLPIAGLAFRRGILTLLVACFMIQPQEVWALDWKDLWLRSDQQAAHLLEEGHADKAAEMFEDKEWKAVAEYRNNNFTNAAEVLEDINTANALYNKGNAMAHAGKLEGAVKSYTEALKITPDMEDSIHNLGLVKQLMQQVQQQAQENGEPSDEQQEGQQQEGQQQEGQQQEGQEQEGQQQQEKSDEGEEDNEQTADENGENQSSEGDEQSADGDSGGDELLGEEEQALEQVLQRVQDDPHKLLRRKFTKLHNDKKRKNKKKPQKEMPW